MAAATAALVDWSRALCDRSAWDSFSSIFEPAAVLPRAFLESCSRGSSWQRWPMLRFIHLVQGLSCSKQKATRQSILCSHSRRLYIRCSGTGAESGAVPFRTGQPATRHHSPLGGLERGVGFKARR